MRATRAVRRAMEKVSVISVPMNLGQPNLGLDLAPQAIIDSGLPDILNDEGWKWNLAPPMSNDFLRLASEATPNQSSLNAKNCLQVGRVSKLIHDQVSQEMTSGTFPLILGGDHCISIGTISAIARKNKGCGIVWVDAHADINTLDTSGSGNMHGMPLAFLLGLVKDANKLPGFEWFEPCLQPKDIVYIGLRDLDRGEKKIIRDLGIKAYTMYDVDRMGIGNVMSETVDYLSNREHIHLSFDIDSIDPFWAPHTGTAVTGGLTFREGNYICETLSESGRLSSMELVEVDPAQHKGVEYERTVECALTLIGSSMGKRIL